MKSSAAAYMDRLEDIRGQLPAGEAFFETRSQRSRHSHGKVFGGPDTYVAVQIVPEGVEPLDSLQRAAAKRRGIQLLYFGEGYRQHDGPSSRLGKAIAQAKTFIKEYKCSN
jgi:hypothetical protein